MAIKITFALSWFAFWLSLWCAWRINKLETGGEAGFRIKNRKIGFRKGR